MTIERTRNIVAGAAAAAILLIGAALLWADREVTRAMFTNRAADKITSAVVESRYLAVDTILHHEAASQKLWGIKHAALSLRLAQLELKPAQHYLAEQMLQNHANIGLLYSQLVKYHEPARASAINQPQYRELEARTVSRLLGEQQEMVSSAFRLAEASQTVVLVAKHELGWVMLAAAAIISAIVAAAWVLITRMVLNPIKRLRKGMDVVAAGNLDYAGGGARADEIGALSVAFDEMTATIKLSHQQLAFANSEMEAFAYSVSHDLRAPLRTLDGFSLVLLEDYADKLDDEGKDSLNRIRAASQRMGMLIDDMLALSQVTRREITLARMDLRETAEEIVAELRQREPQRQLEFIAAPGMTATTDPHLMRIALANLLGNAWKFTGKRAQAKIEFGITEHQGRQAYFIADNGAGFDMAYADKLFGAFQRMHSTAEFEGTGIGLATVQRIIHRLGGAVWAAASPDRGATFYFALDARSDT